MGLVGCGEFDAALGVRVVVPIDKRAGPHAGFVVLANGPVKLSATVCL